MLHELTVRGALGRVPEISRQGHRRGTVDNLRAHGLRVLEEILHEAPGSLILHVCLVLQVSHSHPEHIRLTVVEALLQEDLEVAEHGPCESPDIAPEGSIGYTADGGGHLLLENTVRHVNQGFVCEFRIIDLKFSCVMLHLWPAATRATLVFNRRTGNAQAALRVVHQLPEPTAFAELWCGHLRRVAQRAHAAQQHAGNLLIQC
mmetsp:Transcript_22711/g.53083  ORF Transcript_22711/g.53083 Transcript_22711/m.53083 type:complete len:204 (+) Transcript_22711:2067-2678(+)